MVVDSHVHFWKYDKVRDAWITDNMKILQQDYLPEHLAPTLKRNGVDGVVAVQASQEEVRNEVSGRTGQNTPGNQRGSGMDRPAGG